VIGKEAIDIGAFSFGQLRRFLKGRKVKVTYRNLKVTKKGTVRDVSDCGLVLDSGTLRITPDIFVRVYNQRTTSRVVHSKRPKGKCL